MATKPIVSFTFATDANVTGGPANGFPLKIAPPGLGQGGHVPAQPIVAEYVNYHVNILGDWTGWLLAGSDAPDLDAHLVETDASGYGSLAQLTLGGTPSALQSLIVTQNTGAPSTSIFATNTGTGFAMFAEVVGANAAILGSNTGTGAGLEGRAEGTNNIGVHGLGAGSGAGATFEGGPTGPGVIATAGALGDHGVVAVGTGTGTYGVDATSGASGAGGMRGVAVNVSAPGVQGDTAAAADTSASGVLGNALGNGTGVFGLAVDGYGVVARCDTSSPTRAALRKVPQDADPTTALMGDEMHRSDIDIPRVYTDARWQSPWTTEQGHAHGIAPVQVGTASNGDDGDYLTIAQVALTSPYEPRFAGGNVMIFASARFGDADTTQHLYEVDVLIYDLTAGANVYAGTIGMGPADSDGAADGLAWNQWSIVVPYEIPKEGARQFILRFKPNYSPSGSAVVANNGSIQVIGVFG